MAAFYMEEEEVWKCPKHPSKRRRNGICPVCLKDRLVILCPDCANVRPCACCAAAAATSSSSSASSSFSLFSSSSSRGEAGRAPNIAAEGGGEPNFQRSRSVGIPFLRSSSRYVRSGSVRCNAPAPETGKSKTPSFWSILRPSSKSKSRREKESEEFKSNCSHVDANGYGDEKIAEFTRMMIRSRSVSVTMTSGSGDDKKAKGWHFPSPLKAFRQSKAAAKVVQERSPLYRG